MSFCWWVLGLGLFLGGGELFCWVVSSAWMVVLRASMVLLTVNIVYNRFGINKGVRNFS